MWWHKVNHTHCTISLAQDLFFFGAEEDPPSGIQEAWDLSHYWSTRLISWMQESENTVLSSSCSARDYPGYPYTTSGFLGSISSYDMCTMCYQVPCVTRESIQIKHALKWLYLFYLFLPLSHFSFLTPSLLPSLHWGVLLLSSIHWISTIATLKSSYKKLESFCVFESLS